MKRSEECSEEEIPCKEAMQRVLVCLGALGAAVDRLGDLAGVEDPVRVFDLVRLILDPSSRH